MNVVLVAEPSQLHGETSANICKHKKINIESAHAADTEAARLRFPVYCQVQVQVLVQVQVRAIAGLQLQPPGLAGPARVEWPLASSLNE